MKSMFEYMTTMIVTMILVFIFSVVVSIGTQMLNARLIHSIAIDNIETSYYNYNPNRLLRNDQFKGWTIETQVLRTVNSRRDYLVTLNYTINIPLINTSIDGLKIEGHAR